LGRRLQLRSRADAFVGLISLAIGFVLQAGGYVALIAGATIDTGATRAVLAVGLMLVAALIGWLVLREVRLGRVRRLVVGVARADPASGLMNPYPDGRTLLVLSQLLGFPFFETSAKGVPDLDAYAKRHFGVEQLWWRPPTQVPPPRR
jgi:hypothetical protein